MEALLALLSTALLSLPLLGMGVLLLAIILWTWASDRRGASVLDAFGPQLGGFDRQGDRWSGRHDGRLVELLMVQESYLASHPSLVSPMTPVLFLPGVVEARFHNRRRADEPEWVNDGETGWKERLGSLRPRLDALGRRRLLTVDEQGLWVQVDPEDDLTEVLDGMVELWEALEEVDRVAPEERLDTLTDEELCRLVDRLYRQGADHASVVARRLVEGDMWSAEVRWHAAQSARDPSLYRHLAGDLAMPRSYRLLAYLALEDDAHAAIVDAVASSEPARWGDVLRYVAYGRASHEALKAAAPLLAQPVVFDHREVAGEGVLHILEADLPDEVVTAERVRPWLEASDAPLVLAAARRLAVVGDVSDVPVLKALQERRGERVAMALSQAVKRIQERVGLRPGGLALAETLGGGVALAEDPEASTHAPRARRARKAEPPGGGG